MRWRWPGPGGQGGGGGCFDSIQKIYHHCPSIGRFLVGLGLSVPLGYRHEKKLCLCVYVVGALFLLPGVLSDWGGGGRGPTTLRQWRCVHVDGRCRGNTNKGMGRRGLSMRADNEGWRLVMPRSACGCSSSGRPKNAERGTAAWTRLFSCRRCR